MSPVGPKGSCDLFECLCGAMSECHEVDGLPVVLGDGDGGANRPKGRKRPCPSAGSSRQRPEGVLPADGGHRQGVTFVHRGSHADGEGVVPPALQEVLSNMSSCLTCPTQVEAALDVLANRRKDRPMTLAMFLMAVLSCEGDRHIPKAHLVIAHLIGMNARPVHNIVLGMRKGGHQAIRPRGAGGRPRRDDRPTGREDPMGDEDPPGDEDILAEVASSGAQHVMTLVPQPSGEAEPDPGQIGLKLGALVA